jgi:hypothetical protein
VVDPVDTDCAAVGAAAGAAEPLDVLAAVVGAAALLGVLAVEADDADDGYWPAGGLTVPPEHAATIVAPSAPAPAWRKRRRLLRFAPSPSIGPILTPPMS